VHQFKNSTQFKDIFGTLLMAFSWFFDDSTTQAQYEWFLNRRSSSGKPDGVALDFKRFLTLVKDF